MSHYQRIACLSTESVEKLYAFGAEKFIAGISGFTVVFDLKSPDILSPRPSVIAEGLRQVSDMVAQWQQVQTP